MLHKLEDRLEEDGKKPKWDALAVPDDDLTRAPLTS